MGTGRTSIKCHIYNKKISVNQFLQIKYPRKYKQWVDGTASNLCPKSSKTINQIIYNVLQYLGVMTNGEEALTNAVLESMTGHKTVKEKIVTSIS